MPVGFPLHIHFDTTTTPSAAEIYNASLSATKGDDVRVVYDNQTELNRFVQRFTTAQIDLWFPLQAALGSGQTNTGSYQLYYGSAVAGSPPANINAVFLPQVDSNTMGMWHFQEGTGNTVTDSSGREHHGYFYNAGWGEGYLGNTGVFNGTSAYVEIPHSDDFKPGAITLEAWIYLNGPLSYTARIFTKSRYEFRIHHDGNLQFVINAAGGDRTITGQAKIYANQWYHVAATYDGGTRMRLYVNGVLDKEENFGAPPENWNDYPLRIGREPYDFTSYFPGYIQHARISNVERTNFSYGRVTVSPSVAAGLQLDLEATGTPDLAILDLNTYPNTDGGLLVLALVENQGDAPTQNNFYTDLYVDHLPTGVDDYTDSLQFWVNSPIAAGAHVTLDGHHRLERPGWANDAHLGIACSEVRQHSTQVTPQASSARPTTPTTSPPASKFASPAQRPTSDDVTAHPHHAGAGATPHLTAWRPVGCNSMLIAVSHTLCAPSIWTAAQIPISTSTTQMAQHSWQPTTTTVVLWLHRSTGQHQPREPTTCWSSTGIRMWAGAERGTQSPPQ